VQDCIAYSQPFGFTTCLDRSGAEFQASYAKAWLFWQDSSTVVLHVYLHHADRQTVCQFALPS
jgi:hypothetical protein